MVPRGIGRPGGGSRVHVGARDEPIEGKSDRLSLTFLHGTDYALSILIRFVRGCGTEGSVAGFCGINEATRSCA